MKERLLHIAKFALIILVIIGSIVFFGYEMYRNMKKGSKASGSGVVTVALSNSVTGTVTAGSTFTIGVTLSANTGNTMSAVDLYFTDPQDALDFVMPTGSLPIEDQASNAFDETLRLGTTSRNDGSVRLDRLTMVAKRATANLKTSATLRLRFKARSTATTPYPSAISFGINTGSSVITGPGINGNSFSLTPANVSLPVTLGCTATNACGTDSVCYQDTCRQTCGSGGICTGLYHCDKGACVPGAAGSSSSSSTSLAPTVTPAPTARPEKANLYFRVKMPDVAAGIATVPQVRIRVRDGLSQVAKTVISLSRQQGTDYFRTNSPVELDIPASAAPKEYTVFIKQLKTTQRSFTVTLQRGFATDCTVTAGNCGGSLQNPDRAPLLGGDSDGFQDGSDGTTGVPSFNRIDTVDYQRMVDGYGVSPAPAEPNADFNLDGRMDIFDLGILGKNYGKTGE